MTITGQEVRSAAPALGERVEPLTPGPPVEEEEAVDEAAAEEEEGGTIMGEAEEKWVLCIINNMNVDKKSPIYTLFIFGSDLEAQPQCQSRHQLTATPGPAVEEGAAAAPMGVEEGAEVCIYIFGKDMRCIIMDCTLRWRLWRWVWLEEEEGSN